MRILQVHTRYRESGGEDVTVAAEAQLLREAGHEVHIHEAENPTTAAATLQALARAPRNPAAARRLGEDVRRVRPDVAHVHNTWFAMSPAVLDALGAEGVPTVLTLHNYRLLCANGLLYRDGGPCQDCVGTSPWHGVQHACYRGSRLQSVPAAATISWNRRKGTWRRNVDLFAALTDFAAERFAEGGLPADRLRVTPHFTADPGPRPAPPSASTDVLVVGRLAEGKGVEVVLEAWAAAAPSGLRLVVVGDGPLRPSLEALAGEAVTFTGRVPAAEVRRRLLSGRALLFPSLAYETFGLSLVEAMAAGLPVLASRRGGTPGIVGDAGALADPGDVTAWRQALALLADPAWLDRTGRAGRARWEERFSPAAGLAGLEALYDEAVAARRSSA